MPLSVTVLHMLPLPGWNSILQEGCDTAEERFEEDL